MLRLHSAAPDAATDILTRSAPTSTRKTLSVPSAAKSALTSVPDGAQQSTPTTCAQGTPSVVYSRWSDVEHSKCIFAAHPVLHKVMSPSATRAFQGMKCYNAPSIANAPSAQVLLHDERSSTSEYNMYSSKNKSASSDYTNNKSTEKSKTKCTKCCDERLKCTTRQRSRHTKCSRYNNKCRALQGRSAPTAEHSSQEVHQALQVHRVVLQVVLQVRQVLQATTSATSTPSATTSITNAPSTQGTPSAPSTRPPSTPSAPSTAQRALQVQRRVLRQKHHALQQVVHRALKVYQGLRKALQAHQVLQRALYVGTPNAPSECSNLRSNKYTMRPEDTPSGLELHRDCQVLKVH